jgi:hypothetical protein
MKQGATEKREKTKYDRAANRSRAGQRAQSIGMAQRSGSNNRMCRRAEKCEGAPAEREVCEDDARGMTMCVEDGDRNVQACREECEAWARVLCRSLKGM